MTSGRGFSNLHHKPTQNFLATQSCTSFRAQGEKLCRPWSLVYTIVYKLQQRLPLAWLTQNASELLVLLALQDSIASGSMLLVRLLLLSLLLLRPLRCNSRHTCSYPSPRPHYYPKHTMKSMLKRGLHADSSHKSRNPKPAHERSVT